MKSSKVCVGACEVLKGRLLALLMWTLLALLLVLPTQPAQAAGSYEMSAHCWNNTTYMDLLRPYATPLMQAAPGCFESPQAVLEGICRYMLDSSHGAVQGCRVSRPPVWDGHDITVQPGGSVEMTDAQGNKSEVGHGTNWWGVCQPPSRQSGALSCNCPQGMSPNAGLDGKPDYCVPADPVPVAQDKPCDCADGPLRGNPLQPLRGSKRETLGLGMWAGPLELTLSYDSSRGIQAREPAALDELDSAALLLPTAPAPENWSLNIVRRIVPGVAQRRGKAMTFNAVRGDGRIVSFRGDEHDVYQAPPGTVQRLTKLPGSSNGGWRLDDPREGVQEVYGGDGQLQGIHWADGRRITLSYTASSAPGAVPGQGRLPVAVADNHAPRLTLGYDTGGWLNAVTDAQGRRVQLTHWVTRELMKVIWPDQRTRQFWYGQRSTLLTGIDDERGVRYASFGYDEKGVALSSEHAGGVQRYTTGYVVAPNLALREEKLDDPDNRKGGGVRRIVEWTQPQGVTVTGPTGAVEHWTAESRNGHNYLATQTQQAGSGSTAATLTQTYDEAGNLTSRDDVNGHRSCHANDLRLNRETVRVEGLSTTQDCAPVLADGASLPAGTRKTSTQWHPQWSLVAKRAAPGAITTNVYHGQPDPFNGNALASCAPATAVLPDGSPIAVRCRQVVQGTTDADGHLGFSAVADGTPALTTRRSYNGDGQVLTESSPETGTTTYAYYPDTTADHTRGDLQSITNAQTGTTRFERYDASGLLLQRLDADGVRTVYAYDDRSRLLSVTEGSLVTRYAYDEIGQLKRVTQPDGSWIGHDYDDAHRRIASYDNRGDRAEWTLDAADRPLQVRVKDASGQVIEDRQQAFDALGRLQQATQSGGRRGYALNLPGPWTPLGGEGSSLQTQGPWTVRYGVDTSWIQKEVDGRFACTNEFFGAVNLAWGIVKSCQRYDGPAALNLPISPAAVQAYAYDALGQPTQVTQAPNSLNLTTRLGYDSLDRLDTHTDPGQGTTRLAHDGADHLTQVSDPRQLVTRYPRKGLGDATQLISPDTGTTGFSHDSAHRLKTATDSRGVTQTREYDLESRLTRVVYGQAGQQSTLSWFYDQAGAEYTYGMGRLGRAEHPDGQARYGYDEQGQVVRQAQVIGAVTGVTQYGRTLGRLTSLVYPLEPHAGDRLHGRGAVQPEPAKQRVDHPLAQQHRLGSLRQPGGPLGLGDEWWIEGPPALLRPGRSAGAAEPGRRPARPALRRGRAHHRLHPPRPGRHGTAGAGPGLRVRREQPAHDGDREQRDLEHRP